MRKYFPNIQPIDRSGLVAWTPFIEKDQVLEAYENGVFPWPESEESIFWLSPWKRGVLNFDSVYWTRKDIKFFTRHNYSVQFNTHFESLITKCARMKKKKDGQTWITNNMIQIYCELNELSKIHSVGIYNSYNECVGGLYGVLMPHYFSAESMFYIESNASKLALKAMIEDLKVQGLSWMDTQVVTPFTSRLGASLLKREDFIKRIKIS